MQATGLVPIVLSPTLLRYWYGRLNRELFKNSLPRVLLQYGDATTFMGCSVYGYFMPDEQHPRIHVDTRVVTRGMLISTLAHEMVHYYQHTHGLPLNHGRFFKQQAKRLLKHGITL